MTKRSNPKTVTVHVPMKFSARGGRKTIISEIAPATLPAPRSEDALLKALAKAFRWRSQIESGEYASITELAKAQGVNDSYACRLLRMTLLSPEIVTTILDGRQHPDLTLKQISRPLPKEWDRQLTSLGTAAKNSRDLAVASDVSQARPSRPVAPHLPARVATDGA